MIRALAPYAARVIQVVLMSWGLAGAANGQSLRHHYLIVYGYQDRSNSVHNSHTFASFIESTGSRDADDLQGFESHSISWLPVSRDVRLLRLSPQSARNFSLSETLQIASDARLSVMRWGPIEVSEGFYQAGLRRIAFLESGSVSYIVDDKPYRSGVYQFRSGGAINCIHAVSDVGGLLRTEFRHGFGASVAVFDSLRRWGMATQSTNEWVAVELGVDSIPRHDIRLP